MRLGNQTVTIINPPGRDRFGDLVDGEPGETTVPGCMVQPNGSSESLSGRADRVTAQRALWLPAGVDIKSTSQVRLDDGETYEVDGQIGTWVDFTGRDHHIQVTLRKVRG
ncbi:MAG: hypothetical protein ACRDMV_25335 [Streptosporangiales bacterium]